MKKITLVLAVLFFSSLHIQAQFIDNMEYPTGPPLGPWWETPILIAGPGAGHTGDYSGYVDSTGSVDALLDLGDKTNGEWGLAFYMRISSAKEGYFNLQGPIPGTEFIVGNIYFNRDGLNPGLGELDNSALGSVVFDFPHDEWFRVVINVDITNGISMATWQFGVDGVEVIPAGTPFTNLAGDIPTALGSVDFFAVSSDNEMNVDDFEYVNGVLDLFLNVADNELLKFSVSPNPVRENLNIKTQSNILSSRVYSLQGIPVLENASNSSIDVSQLAAGIYFIQLTTDAGKSVQKFIKN